MGVEVISFMRIGSALAGFIVAFTVLHPGRAGRCEPAIAKALGFQELFALSGRDGSIYCCHQPRSHHCAAHVSRSGRAVVATLDVTLNARLRASTFAFAVAIVAALVPGSSGWAGRSHVCIQGIATENEALLEPVTSAKSMAAAIRQFAPSTTSRRSNRARTAVLIMGPSGPARPPCFRCSVDCRAPPGPDSN